ncbi:phosphoribosylanthranilate isomerase [Litorivivens sp.]|uniref:phosphoribosylanthranilate isomerase n=1 Tax=Litorivivens sp. TaxID=2020868 RepID=UPI0035644549
MPRTRVKICGITRVSDARIAYALGADAIGLVFYKPSPRNISVDQAVEIARAVGPFISRVGLFVNPSAEDVEQVIRQVGLDRLQFHGDESEAFCRQFGLPYIKALRAKPGVDFQATVDQYPSAMGVLLDSYKPGVAGGTGEVFDWQSIPTALRSSIILAGGLNAGNVSEAIRAIRPAAVDVSGGVEESPGIKSADKIEAFIEAVNRE